MAGVLKKEPLENQPVLTWLKELHMECYGRNLEKYPTLKSILDVKDIELKRLGIQNAKDRGIMLGSLLNYKAVRVDSMASPGQDSNHHLKGIKKLTKGLLGSNGLHRKNKKDKNHVITASKLDEPSSSSSNGGGAATTPSSGLSPIPEKSRPDDYSMTLPRSQQYSSSVEDLLRIRKVVENDYVPDPQGSPKIPPPSHRLLHRAYTVGEDLRPTPRGSTSDPVTDFLSELEQDVMAEAEWSVADIHQYSPTTTNRKHLSMVSVESGLGYEPDEKDDFNPMLPLELQPWFHHKMSRSDAEGHVLEDGEFLVHENPHFEGTYTVTVRWCHATHHILIGSTEMATKLGDRVVIGHKYQFDNGAFDTIPELLYNHIKYQIPISKEIGAILSQPVCKFGNRPMDYNGYPLGGKSPAYVANTLPKGFGRPEAASIAARRRCHLASSDLASKHLSTLRPLRASSFSPTSSMRVSSARDSEIYVEMSAVGSTSNVFDDHDGLDEDDLSDMKLGSMYNSASMGDLTKDTLGKDDFLRESKPQGEELQRPPRTANSPSRLLQKPGSTSDLRPPSKTGSRSSMQSLDSVPGGNSPKLAHKPAVEPDDYEVMEAVSIREIIVPSPVSSPKSSHPTSPMLQNLAHSLTSLNDPHYATPQTKVPRQPFSTPSLPHGGRGNTVNYAEVTFNRSMSTSRSTGSTGGYVSRSDLLRSTQHNRIETVTYASPRAIQPENTYNVPRSSPHPFSNYVTIMPQPAPSPAYSSGRPRAATTTSPYAPRSALFKVSKLPQSLQDLPGYLFSFSAEELALHLTKADAVCFLLAPRPGENEELWQNRVEGVNAESGLLVGLQILASEKVGEKLWKKLYYRHLSLSQLVVASLVTIGGLSERTKMLRKLVDLANQLQSGNYGNLFSFLAIMKGLAAEQVRDLKSTWEQFRHHFPNEHNLYENQLKQSVVTLMKGVSVFAIKQLTVPAIQHLAKMYDFEEMTPLGGVVTPKDLHSALEDFTTVASGLDGIRSIVCHTADMSYNAKRRLGSRSFDSNLFDFFMQDLVKVHLLRMNTTSDNALERYRKFSIVLDALISKLETP